jgi:hypothetical protein
LHFFGHAYAEQTSTAKCTLEHYTAFLLAEPQNAGCVRLAKVAGGAFAHDAANRFLNREVFSGRDWATVRIRVNCTQIVETTSNWPIRIATNALEMLPWKVSGIVVMITLPVKRSSITQFDRDLLLGG